MANIFGTQSVDRLVETAGNDAINGDRGNDTVDGGAGDDVHIVDDARDLVEETTQIASVRDNPVPFITLLLAGIVHGDQHDGLDPVALRSLIQRGDLSLTCGPAVEFILQELRNVGVHSRIVALLAPPPFNGFDDGHILLEVETSQGFILIDVDQKQLFLIEGEPASLAKILAHGFDAVDLLSMGPPARVDPSFSIAAYTEAIISNPRPWYERMFSGTSTVIEDRGSTEPPPVESIVSIYFVDSAEAVIEGTGQGRDLVYAGTSYSLGSGVHVELMGTVNSFATDAINLTGNEFSQGIYGNAGSNTLDGGGGADTLAGGAGDDSYVVDSDDAVIEGAGQGRDVVYARTSYRLGSDVHVELMGTVNNFATDAINLAGNEFAQTMYGNAGSNTLDGGGGPDALYGLGGSDTFVFTTPLGSANVATIGDFSVLDDRILLGGASGEPFAALASGVLSASAFRIGSAALNADDRIIYDSATGALYYDADGVGGTAAIQFAQLHGGLALTAAHFTVADVSSTASGEGSHWRKTGSHSLPNWEASEERMTIPGWLGNVIGSGDFGANGTFGLPAEEFNAGDNRLNGLDGDDLLLGGAEGGTLTGGAGRDTFVFRALTDFGTGGSLNVITDFGRRRQDRIEPDVRPEAKDTGLQVLPAEPDASFANKDEGVAQMFPGLSDDGFMPAAIVAAEPTGRDWIGLAARVEDGLALARSGWDDFPTLPASGVGPWVLPDETGLDLDGLFAAPSEIELALAHALTALTPDSIRPLSAYEAEPMLHLWPGSDDFA